MSFARSWQSVWIGAFLLSIAVAGRADSPDDTDLSRPDVAPSAAAEAVRDGIGALLGQLSPKTTAGVVVRDVAGGQAWFASEGDTPLKPASVMKLFVTAAALERFGADFAFETRLYLVGDELIVVGGGDPGLADPRLLARNESSLDSLFDGWALPLHRRGIRELRTIAIDDSIFDQQGRHPDWPDNQAQAWYQAPVGGVNFNDNCIESSFTVRGGKVLLHLEPTIPAGFYRNLLRVGKKHKPIVNRPIDSDVFTFSGTVTRDDQFASIAVRRPAVSFGFALQSALETRNITVAGQVVRRALPDRSPADAEPIATVRTPIRDVIWRCNTFSQNLFAECLLKSLAAYGPDGRPSGEPGSWPNGVRVLRATLADLGVAVSGADFRDGSGLSHENRVTADQIVGLLTRMRTHPQARLFQESLAQPGADGTMRRRYATDALRGRLRGKTGTINGVRTLAGYVGREDGTTLAFAVLLNGPASRDLPKRIAEVIATAGTTTP